MPSLESTTAPSIFGQLAQLGGGIADVEREAAVADGLDAVVVAEHDQGAGAAAQDPFQAVAQVGARRQPPERLAQRWGGPDAPRCAAGLWTSPPSRLLGSAAIVRRCDRSARNAVPMLSAVIGRRPAGTSLTPGGTIGIGEAQPGRLGEPAVHAR